MLRGFGRSLLVVGLRPRAVEHVVRGQVHEPGSASRAAHRQPLDRARVHRERLVLLALADVDVVERRAVEDDVGSERGEDARRPRRRR